MPLVLSLDLGGCFELVDLTSRAKRENKRSVIANALPPILEKLDTSSQEWPVLTTQFESKFKSLAGCTIKLMLVAKALGYKGQPTGTSK